MCKCHLVLCRTCPIWPPVVSLYLTYTCQFSWWNHCISQLKFAVSRPHPKTYIILKKINEVIVSTIQEAISSGYNTFKTYVYKRTQKLSTFQIKLFSHTIKTKCEPLCAFLWWTHMVISLAWSVFPLAVLNQRLAVSLLQSSDFLLSLAYWSLRACNGHFVCWKPYCIFAKFVSIHAYLKFCPISKIKVWAVFMAPAKTQHYFYYFEVHILFEALQRADHLLVQRSPSVCLCDQETPKREVEGLSWTISACEWMNEFCLKGQVFLLAHVPKKWK
jgi:hypothetical protein